MTSLPHIYHFTNLGYGLPFAETSSNTQNCKLILSSNAVKSKRHLIRNCIKSKSLKTKVKNSLNPSNFSIVNDVNSKPFISEIPKGAIGIITGFNQIFEKELIDRFSLLLNFHPSLLPYYRGPVPSKWCIDNKEDFTGYTVHEVTSKIDEGRILYQNAIPIEYPTSPEQLDHKIAKAALATFIKLIREPHDRHSENTEDYSHLYKYKIDYRSF